MDALTAPRAYKKSENASQNKMRGLGIEESDNKGHSDSMPTHHREAPKPRGKYLDIIFDLSTFSACICGSSLFFQRK